MFEGVFLDITIGQLDRFQPMGDAIVIVGCSWSIVIFIDTEVQIKCPTF
jgi:hypothetical protein